MPDPKPFDFSQSKAAPAPAPAPAKKNTDLDVEITTPDSIALPIASMVVGGMGTLLAVFAPFLLIFSFSGAVVAGYSGTFVSIIIGAAAMIFGAVGRHSWRGRGMAHVGMSLGGLAMVIGVLPLLFLAGTVLFGAGVAGAALLQERNEKAAQAEEAKKQAQLAANQAESAASKKQNSQQEAKRRAEDAKLKAIQAAEAEARLKAEELKFKSEEAKRQAAEAKLKAAQIEEARLMAEQEAKRSEEEAKRKIEEARLKEERDAKLKAEEAKSRAEQRLSQAKQTLANLDSGNYKVRDEAISDIADYEEVAPEAARALVKILIAVETNNSNATRPSVLTALGRIGRPAVPALIDAMKHKTQSVRVWSAYTLGRIGEDAQAAVAVLEQAAKSDTAEGVRSAAFIALKRIKK